MNSAREIATAFDLTGPLPEGLLALEASAGTGKTYALAALATRMIAERQVTVSQLCIVTFTEAATAELRGRVRERLVGTADHLEAIERSAGVHPADPLLAHLAEADPDERRQRVARLRAAVADFDTATISTIHGFCSRVLAMSGTSATDGGRSITSGTDDIEEVVNDLLLARHDLELIPKLRPDRLVTGVARRLAMPGARFYLGDPSDRSTAKQAMARRLSEVAAEFVEEACVEVRRRRALQRRTTFDGLLTDTWDLIRGVDAAAVVGSLRDRFRVVLIDEFQDTDQLQWDIFRSAFVDRPELGSVPTVVLVGDPKQSIYRFRSAELSAYLAAVRSAGTSVATLATNWRSDEALLDGLDCLLTGFTFGDDEVAFQPVAPAPGHEGSRLSGDQGAPLQLRCLEAPGDKLGADLARRVIRSDVVSVAAELLGGAVGVPGDGGDSRPLRASDMAVLCRSNAEANSIALQLAMAGIPAATSASNSVLESDAAREWKLLLRALERPGSSGLVRAAALGWFFGHELDEVLTFDEAAVGALHDRVRRWAAILEGRGVPGLLSLARTQGLHQRLLARPGGERNLTDLDHIAELMQTLGGGGSSSPTALLGMLREAGDDPDGELAASDVLARRIDRDDDAVQVLTIHKAKGLEFPVVLCPYLWTTGRSRGLPHAVEGGSRLLDAPWIAGAGGKHVERLRGLNSAENTAESRRLLYVAITRAKHRCILWWAPVTTRGAAANPLSDLFDHRLHGRSPGASGLAELASGSGGTISVTPVMADPLPRAPRVGVGRVGEQVDPDGLGVAVASRAVDRTWRIWSFSSIVAAARDRAEALIAIGDEPGQLSVDAAETITGGGADEPSVDGVDAGLLDGGPVAAADTSTTATRPLLVDAPAGTTFGTLVHELLEVTDFAVADLADELRHRCAVALRFRPHSITPSALAAGLTEAIDAPLGGPLGAVRLRDLARIDRLDELEFHLPLGRLQARDIGRTLATHLPDGDPLAPWARRLAAAPDLPLVGDRGAPATTSGALGFDVDVNGRLTGSIDLVARTPTPNRDGHRYWVADYKTNQLGRDCGYATVDLVDAMVHHDYALQATLYLVALHRYLRWRMPGYRVEQHLGGAAYLFLRGMDPARPAHDARGVFWWQPPAAAIESLDRLLAVGSRA